MVKTMGKSKLQRKFRMLKRHPIEIAIGWPMIESDVRTYIQKVEMDQKYDFRTARNPIWLGGKVQYDAVAEQDINDPVDIAGKRIYVWSINSIQYDKLNRDKGLKRIDYSILTDRV